MNFQAWANAVEADLGFTIMVPSIGSKSEEKFRLQTIGDLGMRTAVSQSCDRAVLLDKVCFQ